jgi:hypothetical protein
MSHEISVRASKVNFPSQQITGILLYFVLCAPSFKLLENLNKSNIWDDGNKSEFHSGGNQERAKFDEYRSKSFSSLLLSKNVYTEIY